MLLFYNTVAKFNLNILFHRIFIMNLKYNYVNNIFFTNYNYLILR